VLATIPLLDPRLVRNVRPENRLLLEARLLMLVYLQYHLALQEGSFQITRVAYALLELIISQLLSFQFPLFQLDQL